MNIKMLVLDLDDTLLMSDKKVNPIDREALIRCERKGLMISSASGRFYGSQRFFLKELELGNPDTIHIGDGGGTIFTQKRLLRAQGYFSDNQYRSLINKIREKKLSVAVTTPNGVFFEDPSYGEYYPEIVSEKKRMTHCVPYLKEISDPMRIIFKYSSEEEKQQFRTVADDSLSCYHAGRNIMEIASAHLNKLNGIKVLSDIVGIPLENIAAIGDSDNDLSMIEGVGLGMAVANASPIIKNAAMYISNSDNDHGGVAELIEEYIL